MIVGVPKEIKPNENRIALVPAGAEALVRSGHQVLVEAGGGLGSGFPDSAYESVGAEIVADVDEVWRRADMIIKVKEPIAPEYERIRDAFKESMPLKNVCDPDDVAAAIVGLITGPDLVTGHVHVIDGGMNIMSPISI